MSKKVRFELNRDGVKELLRSSEMQSIIQECGSAVQNAAGEEYECEIKTGANRCWATISAASPHAYYSNLKHNTLLKALRGVKRDRADS